MRTQHVKRGSERSRMRMGQCVGVGGGGGSGGGAGGRGGGDGCPRGSITRARRAASAASWATHLLLLLLLATDPALGCGPGVRPSFRTNRKKLTPLVFKQHVPNTSENTLVASGPPEGRIRRGSEEFDKLKVNYNSDIIFKDEEGTGADRIMSERCKERLTELSIMVMNQWPGVRLRVTEAWDEDDIHATDSLHYEGRAVDITTSDRDRSKYGTLAKLAVWAGFDWVYYESRGHIHASVKADSSIAAKTGGCFPGSATVTVRGGERLAMDQLREGDHVLAMDASGRLVYDEVFMFLDRDAEADSAAVTIRTEAGHTLTLTPAHLMFASPDGSAVASHAALWETMYAREVEVGYFVLVRDSRKHDKEGSGIIATRVTDVTSRTQHGAYAPLTKHGTIVVDDVIASCYAIVRSQDIAHAALLPMRAWHYVTQLVGGVSGGVGTHVTPRTNSTSLSRDCHMSQTLSPSCGDGGVVARVGVHWYAQALHALGRFLLPRDLLAES